MEEFMHCSCAYCAKLCNKEFIAATGVLCTSVSSCLYLFEEAPTTYVGVGIAIFGALVSGLFKTLSFIDKAKDQAELKQKIDFLVQLSRRDLYAPSSFDKRLSAAFLFLTFLHMTFMILPAAFKPPAILETKKELKNWAYAFFIMTGALLFLGLGYLSRKYVKPVTNELETAYRDLSFDYLRSIDNRLSSDRESKTEACKQLDSLLGNIIGDSNRQSSCSLIFGSHVLIQVSEDQSGLIRESMAANIAALVSRNRANANTRVEEDSGWRYF
jgi:hypothetical protein